MEILVQNWYWFLACAFLFYGCAIANQLYTMSKMDQFVTEGFGFVRRFVPTAFFGLCGTACVVVTVIGLVAKFAG